MNGQNQQNLSTTTISPPLSGLGEDPRDAVLARMEEAAEAGDEYAFLLAYKELEDLDLSPANYVRAMRLALKAGAHLTAREISVQAVRCYPSDSELQKYARILAPPKLISQSLPICPDIEANHNWMKQQGRNYLGQWVAVRNGCLLGVSASFDDLINQLRAIQITDTKDVLLTVAY